jgi:hypothetical protein
VSRLALSLKQPWAALLVSGRKTIEVRRWTTQFRGELLIHAANVDDDRPEAWTHVDDELRPLAQRRRGVIGVAVLAEVCHYRDRPSFEKDQARHLNRPEWFEPRGLYGFRFELARVVPFVGVPGYVRLFEIDVEVTVPVPPLPSPTPQPQTASAQPPTEGWSRFRRLLRTLTRRAAEGE